jgi:cell division protease FtsH
MSEELGLVYVGLGAEHPFLGRAMAEERTYGDETASAIDLAVRHLVDDAHNEALSLLGEQRPALDALAGALLQHETLREEQITAILGRVAGVPKGEGREPVIGAADASSIS